MAEHSAVNRVVVGSSPTRGAKQATACNTIYKWRHGQVVRQRSATPLSPVQIWLAPLPKNSPKTLILQRFRAFLFFLLKVVSECFRPFLHE